MIYYSDSKCEQEYKNLWNSTTMIVLSINKDLYNCCETTSCKCIESINAPKCKLYLSGPCSNGPKCCNYHCDMCYSTCIKYCLICIYNPTICAYKECGTYDCNPYSCNCRCLLSVNSTLCMNLCGICANIIIKYTYSVNSINYTHQKNVHCNKDDIYCQHQQFSNYEIWYNINSPEIYYNEKPAMESCNLSIGIIVGIVIISIITCIPIIIFIILYIRKKCRVNPNMDNDLEILNTKI